ncbi:MAG: sulfotransferase, partial [candidate division Zixibacteria bacterium]|nr:sulfotransferase [candidate division Zixibacteria bacterium]
SNLIEIKFEDLERDPLSQLERIYRHLYLPDFDIFASRVSRYLKQLGDFKKNVFEVSPATKSAVKKRWWQTFELYGYVD